MCWDGPDYFENWLCFATFKQSKFYLKNFFKSTRYETTPRLPDRTPKDSISTSGGGFDSDSESDADVDRQWYNIDEEMHNDLIESYEMGSNATQASKNEKNSQNEPKIGHRARQFRDDYKRWETSRIEASGVFQKVGNQRFSQANDQDEDFGTRVHLLVHNIIPPFLDGRFIFTRQPEPVLPVKVI